MKPNPNTPNCVVIATTTCGCQTVAATDAACCDPTTCCEPSDKAGCCGRDPKPATCGCQ